MSNKIVQPTYLTKQPSTGKSVKYRPFTVREEKSLLLALQEDDIETVANAIKSIVSVCTDGKVDPENAPYYDVEYLFLQIRSKSVGEIIELVGSCQCGPDKKTDFQIDIGDIKIEPAPTTDNKLSILDTNYTIEFRHPSIDDIVITHKTGDMSEHVVANCMGTVFTDDEVLNWTHDEKLELVESMTPKQQKNIGAFLKNMPMVKMDASYTCRHCNKHHKNVVSGFENFFI
jgi:T4 bacteriophage base plate protein